MMMMMMMQICSSFLSHSPISIQRGSRGDPCPQAGGWLGGVFLEAENIQVFISVQLISTYAWESKLLTSTPQLTAEKHQNLQYETRSQQQILEHKIPDCEKW